jgi:short-subunit dehydrogenase
MLLENKYAVISGAAAEDGIGYATAGRLAKHGATVAILERKSPQKKSFVTGATIDVNGGIYIRA